MEAQHRESMEAFEAEASSHHEVADQTSEEKLSLCSLWGASFGHLMEMAFDVAHGGPAAFLISFIASLVPPAAITVMIRFDSNQWLWGLAFFISLLGSFYLLGRSKFRLSRLSTWVSNWDRYHNQKGENAMDTLEYRELYFRTGVKWYTTAAQL